MIYIVDHKDSFTYNLVHLFSEFDVVCIANYFEVNYSKMEKSKLIVFSSRYVNGLSFIDHFCKVTSSREVTTQNCNH